MRTEVASTLEWLECSRCRKATSIEGLRGRCEACGGVLLARYRLDEATRTLTPDGLRTRRLDQWRYARLSLAHTRLARDVQ